MTRSMTGFGRAELSLEGVSFAIEISSVNRKQLDVQVQLPRGYQEVEAAVRGWVGELCGRGRVQVSIAMQQEGGAQVEVQLNEKVVQAYVNALEKLDQGGFVREKSLDAADWLRVPEALQSATVALDEKQVLVGVKKAFAKAQKEWMKMREVEGKHLQKDLLKKLKALSQEVEALERRAELLVPRYREQLLAKLQEAQVEVESGDERLLKEVVLFAEKVDVSEELIRLQSHFEQWETFMKEKEARGRSLDFLAQEIFRELNTIGSKANDGEMAHHVVEGKTVLEKMREQVQNIE